MKLSGAMAQAAKLRRKTVRARGTGGLHVYQELRDEILQLRVRPGSALDEMGLSERFGLSRSPVREALIRLAGEGLVEILPNRSTIVAPIDVQKMPTYLDALDMMQRITHRLAAMQRDEDDLNAIKAAQMDFERAVDEAFKIDVSLPIIDSNYEFHMTVARAGKNPYFETFYRRLLDEGRRMLHLHFIYQREDKRHPADLTADHIELIRAIEARDADQAEAVAHSHADQFRGRFLEFVSRSLTADMKIRDIGDD